ncbi:MAG: flagellar brake protein [Cellvibrionaceae bacterium]
MNSFFQSALQENSFFKHESSLDNSHHPSFDNEQFDSDGNPRKESFLSKLFGFEAEKRKNIKNDVVDLGLNHVYLALNKAYKNRDFLEVKVSGDSTIYQSILLEIDPEERTVLIDEFFPATFVGLPGQKMHFSLRQKEGRSIVFEASIMERHEFDGSPVYVISMPDTLDQNQRRVAFRMDVPRHSIVDSTFIGPDKQAYKAKVCDVSSGGVCIETSGEITKALRAGDSLKNTSFEFAGVDIVCDLTIKNLLDKNDGADGSQNNCRRIGAQFDNLPSATRRQLEQSIMQLQREQLRRASNSREHFLN